jgi:uncharacterized protein
MIDSSNAHSAGWKLPPKVPFEIIENEWITLEDGTKLAVRLWMPQGAGRVPVVMEYLPYRKGDVTRSRDAPTGRYLAEHGIAFARVDIRGTGNSDGVLGGEYTVQQQTDAVEVIGWLSRQTWSNGAVGMRGKSWGGFAALQVAALAPPPLKAIMPCCFSDNQYTDDAHFYGGALSNPNFYWGAFFQNVMASPPDPAIVGEHWREMWLERLESLPPSLADWTSHQRFDEHWKIASVAVDYRRVKCPVYAVGALVDHYLDVTGRVMAHLEVPRKCLIGPWAHNWPDGGDPGPSLDWVSEEVRWWEHWLKGVPTGIMDEPMFRVFIRDRTAVEVYPQDTPGHWAAEDIWPSPRVQPTTFFLNPDGLSETPGEQTELCVRGDTLIGMLHGEPDAFFFPEDLPQEQSPDDAQSLVFESRPLVSDLEVVGNPMLKVRVSADAVCAKIAVRLMEVTPEGRSWMVGSGLLNLTHRESHEHPEPLEPGRRYDVDVPLSFTSQRFKSGCRLRVALSENLWPLAWPSPRIATLTVTTCRSKLILPVRSPKPIEDAPRVAIVRNVVADGEIINARGAVQVSRERLNSQGWASVKKVFAPLTTSSPDTATHITRGWTRAELTMKVGDPNSCRWSGEFATRLYRGTWDTTVVAGFEVTSTAEKFIVKESVRATEAEEVVFERQWEHAIDRDLM